MRPAPGSGKRQGTPRSQPRGGSAFDPDAVRLFLQVLAGVGIEQTESARFQLSELRPGMVLAKGVYNAKGALLLPEGQTLNETPDPVF